MTRCEKCGRYDGLPTLIDGEQLIMCQECRHNRNVHLAARAGGTTPRRPTR